MNLKDNDNNMSTETLYAIKLCKQIIKDLRSGKCSEEQIHNIIVNTEPRSHGFINPDDYLPAEAAMKMLGVHRNQFFSLTKQYGIKCHKINNQPIGFHRNDLETLRSKIDKS